LKAAIRYRGFALIDVISPCVTFNNHAGSTKSYDYVREHNAALDRIDFVASQPAIAVDYAAGTSTEVSLHDGTVLRLHKLAEDYDPTSREAVLRSLERHRVAGEVATGLLYLEPAENDLHDLIGTVAAPLNTFGEAELCPGNAALEAINARHG
jgi:2-oxoglutarate ferredoxin oxidoreductase subunit beta